MKTKSVLPLNLQLFAEGGAAGNSDPAPQPTDNPADEAGKGAPQDASEAKPNLEELLKEKDFSDAFEKRVAEGVQAALDAKAEEEKLAGMSPEEKDQKRAADLDAREKALLEKELRISATEKLAAAEVPKELVDLVNYTSSEAMETSIATVIESFNKAVQAGVDSRLAGSGPLKKAPENTDSVDEEAIAKAIRGEY
ncbi:MAG: DUF4355 domain-containing protein [Lachnospiraceae bacterium]|nr:DUF4355 domain-containing protein [Lachnospiraceae bacterium]